VAIARPVHHGAERFQDGSPPLVHAQGFCRLLDTDAKGTAMQKVRATDDRGARDSISTDAVGTRVPRKPMMSVHIPINLPKKLPEVAAEAQQLSILRAECRKLRKRVPPYLS